MIIIDDDGFCNLCGNPIDALYAVVDAARTLEAWLAYNRRCYEDLRETGQWAAENRMVFGSLSAEDALLVGAMWRTDLRDAIALLDEAGREGA